MWNLVGMICVNFAQHTMVCIKIIRAGFLTCVRQKACRDSSTFSAVVIILRFTAHNTSEALLNCAEFCTFVKPMTVKAAAAAAAAQENPNAD